MSVRRLALHCVAMKTVIASLVISIAALLPASVAWAESEIVTFSVADLSGTTVTLQAKLNKPDGDGPFPAVVMLHGFATAPTSRGNGKKAFLNNGATSRCALTASGRAVSRPCAAYRMRTPRPMSGFTMPLPARSCWRPCLMSMPSASASSAGRTGERQRSRPSPMRRSLDPHRTIRSRWRSRSIRDAVTKCPVSTRRF